jgi:hypothetical protein
VSWSFEMTSEDGSGVRNSALCVVYISGRLQWTAYGEDHRRKNYANVRAHPGQLEAARKAQCQNHLYLSTVLWLHDPFGPTLGPGKRLSDRPREGVLSLASRDG